jgi:hypothetical protein
MKFLCDVHISRKIVNHLKMNGHQATHVYTRKHKSS